MEAFEDLEQVYGSTYNPCSVLLNETFLMDRADIIMYGWAHCYVSNGLGDTEFGMFMHTMSTCTSRGGGDPSDCTYANLYM